GEAEERIGHAGALAGRLPQVVGEERRPQRGGGADERRAHGRAPAPAGDGGAAEGARADAARERRRLGAGRRDGQLVGHQLTEGEGGKHTDSPRGAEEARGGVAPAPPGPREAATEESGGRHAAQPGDGAEAGGEAEGRSVSGGHGP